MKIIFAFISILAIGCSTPGDNPSDSTNASNMLTAKTWVADSVYQIQAGVTTKTAVTPPAFLKVKYSSAGTYLVTSSYDAPLTKNYELVGNKIYYWNLNGQKDPDSFSIILKLESNFYVDSKTKENGEEIIYFMHEE